MKYEKGQPIWIWYSDLGWIAATYEKESEIGSNEGHFVEYFHPNTREHESDYFTDDTEIEKRRIFDRDSSMGGTDIPMDNPSEFAGVTRQKQIHLCRKYSRFYKHREELPNG